MKLCRNRFFKAPSEFTTNDVAAGFQAFKVEVDMTKAEDPTAGIFETLCYMSSGENINDNIISWDDFCGQGGTSNVIAGYDYEVPFSAKLRKGDLTDALHKARFDSLARSGVNVKITNTLMNEVAEFKGIITVSSVTVEPKDIMEISGSIKVYTGGITLTPAEVETPTRSKEK